MTYLNITTHTGQTTFNNTIQEASHQHTSATPKIKNTSTLDHRSANYQSSSYISETTPLTTENQHYGSVISNDSTRNETGYSDDMIDPPFALKTHDKLMILAGILGYAAALKKVITEDASFGITLIPAIATMNGLFISRLCSSSDQASSLSPEYEQIGFISMRAARAEANGSDQNDTGNPITLRQVHSANDLV